MEKPAVNFCKKTAGKLTKLTKKCLTILCAGAGIFLLCAFSSPQRTLKPLVRTTKTVIYTQKIPFETTYIDLPTIYRGYTEQISQGVAGEKQIEAQLIYEGNRLVRVASIRQTQTANPVNAVMKRGARVLHSKTADGSRWKSSFIHPLKNKGWLSADYYDYPKHHGADFAAPYGTPVYAAAQGIVVLAGWYGEYGRCVILEHADGTRTLYAHNSTLLVSRGQSVYQGEQIAKVGSTGNSTGNHLHFELRVGERFLDPLVYLDR